MKKEEKELLLKRLKVQESMINALNSAVIALAYKAKVTGKEMDKITYEEYESFVKDKVQPLVATVDKLIIDQAKKEVEAEEGDK